MEQEQKSFEQFITEQIEGYRMYPSANVWRNINKSIGNKTKPTVYALIALAVLTIFTFNFSSEKSYNNYNTVANITNTETDWNSVSIKGVNLTANTLNKDFETNKIAVPTAKASTLISNALISETNRTIANPSNNIAVVATTTKPSSIYKSPKVIETLVTTKENTDLIATTNATEISEPISEANLPTANNEASHNNESNITECKVIPEENKPTLVTNIEETVTEFTTPLNKVKKKATLQMYITPGISYRLLYDKRNNTNNIPFASQGNNNGVNATVFHKPAFSIEGGAAWIKPINNNLEFKAGVQVNYNSYKIKASYTNTQLATIALSNNNGSNYQINSITNWSTAESAYPTWVENTNVQLSVPVGLNFLHNKHGKAKFGIGTTIQPTVKVYNKAMLLSTDLKNYTTAPYLVRNFNLNAGLEAFIALKGKKLSYQFGPQLRYQVMSTYAKKYPFKENLFDYGFKIAVSNPF